MAKKKRHSAAEVAAKLGQADALAAEGRTQSEIAKALGITVMTLHRWRKAAQQTARSSKVAGLGPAVQIDPAITHLETDLAVDIAELQLENARLRTLVTDLLLEKMSLEDDQRQHGRVAKRREIAGAR